MKKLFLTFTIVFLLAGCGAKLSFFETDIESVDKNVQDFVLSVTNTNGIYLYTSDTNKVYVFLNGINQKQGESFFKQFHVSSNYNVLDISYTEDDLDVTDKSLKNQMLYQINLDKEYNTFQLFKNGEKISFDVVSGN